MPSATASVPMGCERCTSGAARGVAYTLRRGSQRLLLDHDAVIGRIHSRELAGTDFVRCDDGQWVPVAEHPSFRRFFFPGVVWPEPSLAATSTRGGLGLSPVLRAAALLGVIGVVGAVAWNARPVEPILPAPPVAPSVAPAAPEAPAAPAVAPDTTMSGLTERVGAVSEPRALLLAGAWRARFRGGDPGLAEAVRLAERAVVRIPDAETLAVLAMLYAESRAEPDLRTALIKRARDLKPDHIAVVRAELAEALVEGRKEDARAFAVRCLQLDAHDTWCAVHTIALTEDQTADARMQAYDALAATSQPDVALVVRESAKAAIQASAQNAAARVEAVLKLVPGDPELNGYKGVLALRNGDLKTAIATARTLGEKAPARLRLDLAAHDIGAGDASSAREWLAPLAAHEPDDADERFWLHLHGAQADYLEALVSPDRMRGAADAADSVLAARPHDATAAQVRMLASLAAGDITSARKAWGNADAHGLPGPDVAQLFLTAVEIDLTGSVAREAIPQLEAAQKADPASPDVWLWTARVGLEARDGNMAIAALRSAVAHVDGTASRRNPLGYALPRPADAAKVQAMLHDQLDGAVGQGNGLAVALATVDWLSGNNARALEGISRLVRDGTDPDAMILAARIHLAAGDAAKALPLAEAAAAARPKEGHFQLLRARILHSLGRDADARKALGYVRGAGDLGCDYYLLLAELADGDARVKNAQQALLSDPYNQDAVRLFTAR